MNIIKVIVDELPRSASRCPATDRFWPGFDEVKNVTCKLTGGVDQLNRLNDKSSNDTQTDTFVYGKEDSEVQDVSIL